MRSSRVFGIWGLALLLSVLTAGSWGCAKLGGAPTVKISSWGDVKENAILTDLINEFMKSHPDVKVELQRVPWGEYNTKLLTQYAGGIAPDVIFVSTDNIADLYYRHVLAPLDEYVKADPNFPVKDFYPTVMDRFTIDGSLYVIPRDISPVCLMYYNKKAFDEAGVAYPKDSWTWADFLAVSKKLVKKDASGRVTRWAFTEDWAMVEPWIYSSGGRWVDNPQKPGKWAFDTPEFVRGLQFRADLMLKYKIMPTPANMTAMGGTGSSDMFVNGTTAMMVSGVWKTPQFRDIKAFDWDVALFPRGPEGQRGYQSGGSGYGIMNTCKNKKAAWDLVSFLSGADGQRKMAATGLVQPSLMSAANSPVFLDGQKPLNKKILLAAEPFGIFMPLMVNWLEFYQGSAIPTFDNIWSGKITAQQAVSKLVEASKNRPLNVQSVGK